MLRLSRVLVTAVALLATTTATASAQNSGLVPAITTGAPVDVRWTSATVAFSVIPTVVPATAFIQYGTTADLGTQSAPYEIAPSAEPTNATIELTGLRPETTYTYRAYARNTVGIPSWGAKLTFTTTAVPPDPPPRRGGDGTGATGGQGGRGGAGGGSAPACAARGARPVAAGAATITLDRAFVRALASGGYRTSATGAATSAGRTWKLPLSGGALDARARAGRLCASGGLALRGRGRAGTAIDALALTLAARRPGLSARVGRRTVALATLGPVALAGSGRARTASRIRATLTAAGASALRGALGTRAPRTGAVLGTLSLRVTLR